MHQKRLIVVLTAMLGVPPMAIGDDPTPKQVLEKLREERRKDEALAKQAEAEARRLRLALVEQAMKLQEARRRDAITEREKVQRELDVRQRQVALNEQVLGWATRGFEPGRAAGPAPVAEQPDLLARWQRSRDIARQQFLEFPEQSRGAIKSGRALNTFLDLCGEAARQQQLFRRQAAETRAALEREIAALEQQPAAEERDARLNRANERMTVLRAREELLRDLSGKTKLSEYDRSRIRCLQGGAGPKLVQSVVGDPMPLEWPHLLRDEKYAQRRAAIEVVKKRALVEIGAEGGVRPETVEELTADIESLAAALSQDREEFMNQRRAVGQAARAYSEGKGGTAAFSESPGATIRLTHYPETRRFVQGLRYSVVRLAAARSEQDVQTAPFQGETVEELMAFMCDHGLRFDQADINSELTHDKIFRGMTEYYLDLSALPLAGQAEQRQVQELQERERQLRDIVDGRGEDLPPVDDPWEPWRLLLRGLQAAGGP